MNNQNNKELIEGGKKKMKPTIEETMGWTWAKACSLLDEEIDPRDFEIPKLIEEFREIDWESRSDCV